MRARRVNGRSGWAWAQVRRVVLGRALGRPPCEQQLRWFCARLGHAHDVSRSGDARTDDPRNRRAGGAACVAPRDCVLRPYRANLGSECSHRHARRRPLGTCQEGVIRCRAARWLLGKLQQSASGSWTRW